IRIFDSRFLSIERIYDEFGKILAPGLKDNQFLNDYLPKLNIFKQFFPDPETAGKVMERIVETGSHLPLAFQYHKTHTIAETSTVLKLSRENKRLILLLKEFSEQDLSDNTILKSLLSKAEFIDINALLIAINDLIGVDVTRHVLDIIKKGQPYRVKDLALQGNDLQELGIKGRGIGLMINLLLNAVWAQPQLNSKEQLLRLAADLKEKMRDSNPDAGD
ncbi:MAG: hypothetical protein HOE30_01420, partial [Deltaproteobacteria bacterium]|nr:hypothetical protein [Deltaproteobacteria bacterium]